MKTTGNCACGSGRTYEDCCGRWHAGTPAPDAAYLMRSRYSAFVLGLEEYLLTTWHASTRPDALGLDAGPAIQWIGLAIKRHAPADENHAVVEFVARYKVNGRAHRLHEVSRFVREDGRWFYLDGEFPGDA